jgi:hypothetical protein
MPSASTCLSIGTENTPTEYAGLSGMLLANIQEIHGSNVGYLETCQDHFFTNPFPFMVHDHTLTS